MYFLRILKLDMESIKTKESWIKELMNFVREKSTNYTDADWMAFVCFYEFLISKISLHYHNEEKTENKVAKILDN
jgi:hypothetical protein